MDSNQYYQSILDKWGIHNVEAKLNEEIHEYIESEELEELADIYNVICTINHHERGIIFDIADKKRKRTIQRMQSNWYDDNGLKPREDDNG